LYSELSPDLQREVDELYETLDEMEKLIEEMDKEGFLSKDGKQSSLDKLQEVMQTIDASRKEETERITTYIDQNIAPVSDRMERRLGNLKEIYSLVGEYDTLVVECRALALKLPSGDEEGRGLIEQSARKGTRRLESDILANLDQKNLSATKARLEEGVRFWEKQRKVLTASPETAPEPTEESEQLTQVSQSEQEWKSVQSRLKGIKVSPAIELLESFVKKHPDAPEASEAKQEAFRQLSLLFNTLVKDQNSIIVLKNTLEEFVGQVDDTQTDENAVAILVEENGQPKLERIYRSAIVVGPTYKEKPKESELYNKERKRIRAQLENGNTVPLLKFADLCTELGFDSDAESVEHIMRVIQKAPTIFGEDIIATMKSSKLTEDEKKRLPINTPDEPGSSEKAEIPEDQSGPVASQKQPPRAHFVSLNRATPSPSTAPTSTPTPTPSTAEVPQSYPDRPHIEYHRYGDGNFRVESKDRIESIYHVSGDVTQTKEEFLQSLMLLVWRPAEGTEYSVKRLANITSHLSKSREWEIHLRCRALSSRSLYLKRSADGRIWKIGFGISDKVTDINDPEIPETLRKIGEKYIGKPFNDVQATLLDSELRAELCNLFQTPAVSICEAACVFQPTEDPQAISSRLFSKDSFLVNDGNEWRKQFRKNGRFPYDNFVNVIVDEPRDFAFLNQLAERIDLKVTFSKGPIANAVIEDLDLTMSYIPPSIQSVLDSFSEHKYPLTPETIQKIHREVTYAITDLRTLSQEERQQMLSDQELYIEKTFNQIMYEMKEIKKSFPNYTEEQFARATELAKENKRIREGLTLVWRRKNQQWKWKPVEFEWPMNTYEWSIKKINGVPREEYKEKERKLQERIAQNHEDWDRLQEEHKRERDESEKREQEKLEEEKREQDRLEREERDREKSSIIYRTNKWLRKHHFL